jgi:hypothetical protein
MAAGDELAGAACVGAELPMATGVELAMAAGLRVMATRTELAPPPWLELE